MNKKLNRIFILILALLLIFLLLSAQSIEDYFKYNRFYKNNLVVNISSINKQVHILSAEASNKLYLKIEVRNLTGSTIPNVPVNVKVKQGPGKVFPSKLRTDKSGEAILTYIPPASHKIQSNTRVDIKAGIHGTPTEMSYDLLLQCPPVVLIHGYQEHPGIFDNMTEYLKQKSFNCEAFDYNSGVGVFAASKSFEEFLQRKKAEYLMKGIQVNKFDIIAHSMGGLVARYYSSSGSYIKKNDINRIIFVSVPHKGSYWATIGTKYFNDQGIKDLIPDNPLLTKDFPSLLNKGLNSTIQTGSILGQYDEVVTPESASLEEWKIKTELFNVGENNLTMNNLLNGDLLEASNHKNVLFNKKVFEKIEEMLRKDLPYPSLRND